MKLMDLLLAILHPPTIVEGLQSPSTAMKARDLILVYQSRELEKHQGWLLVGGMALSREDISERKSKRSEANINSWSLGR